MEPGSQKIAMTRRMTQSAAYSIVIQRVICYIFENMSEKEVEYCVFCIENVADKLGKKGNEVFMC